MASTRLRPPPRRHVPARPALVAERLLGRRRARRLRRRAGLAALATGFALLLPTLRLMALTALAGTVALVAGMALL